MAGRQSDRLARARSHARRFPRPFWILVGGDAIESFAYGLVVPYFALYVTDTIGASPAQAGWVMAIWSAVALGGTPLGGVLADRLGRRPVMIAGLAGAGVASIAFGLANGLWAVAVLIVLWAAFSSVFDPAASAYVADVVDPGLRTEAYGIARVVGNASFALGAPAGALVIWAFSLRATFILGGICLLAYLAFVIPALPESRQISSEDEPPARFREALRDRTLIVLAVATLFAAYGYALYEGVLPVFLHDERGLAVAAWGLVFAVNPVVITLLQYPVARWAARRSARSVLALGAVLMGASVALLLPTASVAVLVVAVAVMSFGEMLISPVSQALAADLAPERLRGSYQGVLNLAWEISWGPTTIVGLWLVGAGLGSTMLASGLALGAVAALLYLRLPVRRLQAAPEPIEVPLAP